MKENHNNKFVALDYDLVFYLINKAMHLEDDNIFRFLLSTND